MFVRLLLILLAVLCVLMGVHYVKRTFGLGPGLPDLAPKLASLFPSITPTPMPPSPPAKTSAALLESSPQQLGRLLAVPLLLDDTGLAPDSVSLDYIRENKPSMVVLFGTDIPATVAAKVVANLHQLPAPPIIAVDHEGGTVQRLAGEGFTKLPSWQQLCAMTADKRKTLIASSAAELQQVGIDVVLGPVVDLAASGSALKSRSCARSPETVAAIAQELITSYQTAGISPVLKHYPGIGSARFDLHTQSAAVKVTPEDTRPFELLLTANLDLPVMISHLRVDPADPDTPCSMSFVCVSELRRVFPNSLLISDALEMKSAGYLATSSAALRPLSQRVSAVSRAGVDLLLFGPSVNESELKLVQEQLAQELTIGGRIDKRTTDHLTRLQQWRTAVTQLSAQ